MLFINDDTNCIILLQVWFSLTNLGFRHSPNLYQVTMTGFLLTVIIL